MKKQVMVTTLFKGDALPGRTYYYFNSGNGKVLYTDALMPVEAACRFMLSMYKLDKIVIFIPESNKDTELVSIRDGKSLFGSDLKGLSGYDLIRYRLAEYAEETHDTSMDDMHTISDENQKKAAEFISSFFQKRLEGDAAGNKANRYFHILAQDQDMQHDFFDSLYALFPDEDRMNLRAWALDHLYTDLKDSAKMEPLAENLDVKIQSISMRRGESFTYSQHIAGSLEKTYDVDTENGEDIYMYFQNGEASTFLDVIHITDLTKLIPDNWLQVNKIFTTTSRPDMAAQEISDSTILQNISGLLAGASSFLYYGKTKGLLRYWDRVKIDNSSIEQAIYAMRNIDNGISLCDISDIERGIDSLRDILKDDTLIGSDSVVEHVFDVIFNEGIRKDYGRLLETDEMEFIDLVKWAYKKEFWQQTLTLIESRAPRDFVKKGFYYYCDSEEKKEQVVKIFGQIYYDLKSYEKYKLDDVAHYFVKYYNRGKASHSKHGKEYDQDYARVRVEDLDTDDPGEIRACSACSDRSALEDLLFAYYYVGDVRNETNHAEDTFNGFTDIMEDSDSSERMDTIRQCINYFLYCYDKVAGLTDSKNANVIEITNEEITAYADVIRKQYRNKNNSNKNNDNSNSSNKSNSDNNGK